MSLEDVDVAVAREGNGIFRGGPGSSSLNIDVFVKERMNRHALEDCVHRCRFRGGL